MNTLSQSGVKPAALKDPGDLRADRVRFERGANGLLSRANSLYSPSGRWPCRAWVLVSRRSYDAFDPYSTNFQLTIDTLPTFTGLSLVQAQCVSTGVSGSKDALYLLELTDSRGVVWNEWFQWPVDSARDGYNCRAPAYKDNYYTSTLNGSDAWTWSTMVGDLWSQMSARLGAFPGLPSVPAGTPENWWASGMGAWSLLCDVLEHIGMTVAWTGSSYSIVLYGGQDDAFTAAEALYAGQLKDDLQWKDFGAARVPATVEVMFRRRNDHYGTEETVRRDSLQWEGTPFYSVTVDAPSFFTGAVGKHYLWDDFSVRYDVDDNPLASDVEAARGIAQDRVNQYFGKIYSGTSGFMTRLYGGALPFRTGPQVDGVAWVHSERGWETHVVRGPNPPFQELWEGLWIENKDKMK